MTFYITNRVQVSGLHRNQIHLIKKYLTISNPLFTQKVELNLGIWGVPDTLKYYEKAGDQSLFIPVGALSEILKLLDLHGAVITKTDIIDGRTVNQAPDYFSTLSFNGKLRPYQEKIVKACQDKTLGVIEAMTGSGKTITFVALTVAQKQPTMIMVNTIELANQTIAAFEKFTNIKKDDVGFIGSGEFNVRPISIALHQTLANLSPAKFQILNGLFSQIIADEVHIVAAETYYKTLSQLTAKFKYGFSATPYRDDGLTKVIHFATGPTIHTVPKDELVDEHGEKVLIKPSIRYVDTNYDYPLFSSSEYQDLITDLSSDEERNNQIIDLLKSEYKDNYVCLLCLRIEQVQQLHEALGDQSVMLTSKMKKKDRKNVMKQLVGREKQYVISTFGLFSTGIDIPHLDTLFLCAPIKSRVKITQAAGRLMRKAEGKTKAEIVDFVDKKINLLKYQSYTRRRILNNL